MRGLKKISVTGSTIFRWRIALALSSVSVTMIALMFLLVCQWGGAPPLDGGRLLESHLGGLDAGRRPVLLSACVRPPLVAAVCADLYSGHPRLYSVLSRGLKVRVPAAVPRVWRLTPLSALMSAAVRDFVSAWVLRPGRPRSC